MIVLKILGGLSALGFVAFLVLVGKYIYDECRLKEDPEEINNPK